MILQLHLKLQKFVCQFYLNSFTSEGLSKVKGPIIRGTKSERKITKTFFLFITFVNSFFMPQHRKKEIKKRKKSDNWINLYQTIG